MIKIPRFLQTLSNQNGSQFTVPSDHRSNEKTLTSSLSPPGEINHPDWSHLGTLAMGAPWNKHTRNTVTPFRGVLSTLVHREGCAGRSSHSARELEHNPNFTCKLFMYVHRQPKIFTILSSLQAGILWFENVSTLFKEGSIKPVSSAWSFPLPRVHLASSDLSAC